jgi:hypothetical protein
MSEVPQKISPGPAPHSARVIAYYLPQFHPIPENDEWWGKGFTEWTNVARAKPLFRGHRQPVTPADLGFYDLRLAEIREAQAELAREHGITAFCYWHYWFGNGRRLLERPFTEVLQSGRPDFPFCLAWANQSWTGIWHGAPGKTLIEQTYPGRQDEARHFEVLLPAFHDNRYLKVDGKPLFCVYSPTEMPNPGEFIEHWRELAARSGLRGIFFVAICNDYRHASLADFDAVTPLVPQDFLAQLSVARRVLTRLRSLSFGELSSKGMLHRLQRPLCYQYREVVERAFAHLPDEPRFLPCVLPNWDNTPRSGSRGLVLSNCTPALFKTYLDKAIRRVAVRPAEEQVIFLKAWNEWAEGNFVEPDSRLGHGYLDVIRAAIFTADPLEQHRGADVSHSYGNRRLD